ncbi:tetratricopeptide repeat-containing sulfotransferase family protein [Brevundimonas aveniformis]|uniref:tetratricopeptide repeat-containing sulfotransferase family protein n=1 Tax=Brevundimonas aveniformis TaxID=370977 RepID=UPI0024905EA4|nr:tetratricopeptide repeat-containing sulfotransferase family protein [Brevundimonas aveniformis]
MQDRRGGLACDFARDRRNWPGLEHAARAWISRRPDQPLAWREAARALFEMGRHTQAVKAFERVQALEPESAANHAALGGLLLHALDYEAARVELEQALALDPDHVGALSDQATLFTYLGRFAEAEAACRAALERNPDHAPAFTLLSRLTGGRLTEAETARLSRITEDPRAPLDRRIPAAFARAHALDADGKVEAAFTAYGLAHALSRERDRLEGRAYDHATAVDRARRIVALPLAPAQPPGGSPRPIFVVGMARSGTTLVEAMLASHTRVFGAGERVILPGLLEAWLARSDAAPDAAWARAYLEGLGDLGGRDHVTDKMPRNLESVGLITRLFPDAPIILMRRDPVETCLSLYRQEFSRDWAFVHDLADLGRAYGLTARLAAHWARALPGRMIEVQYETLAEDFAAEARRIVAACGLDWDAACESPSKSPRPIATFSTVSARSPVRVMNDRAEAYRPYLGGLIGALEAEGVDLTTGGLKAGVESGLA